MIPRRAARAAALGAIVALGAALRFGAFAAVPANPFYDAAVRSMSLSWHNFVLGAFEPGGSVSVDKVPVDLWLQVASVQLFGFSSTSLRLPEALAGTLAIPLLYLLVRRLFDRRAGLAAAAAMAVLPAAVLTARSDTMDSVMMALVVLSAWLVLRGAQERSTRSLLLGGAVLGLAFNVKLFEALVVVPALVVLYCLAAEGSVVERARRLAGSGAAFVGVALSWLVAVSLLPGRRPFPIGSTDGSVWNVVFVFNGTQRLDAAAALRPGRAGTSGPARLLDPAGPLHLGGVIGTELLAALVLGAAAVVGALVLRRGRGGRRSWASVAFLAVWLLTGVVLFTRMRQLNVRYLEAMTPSVAAVLGASVAWLASQAARRPAMTVALGAGVVASVAGSVVSARVAGSATVAAGVAAAAFGGGAAVLVLLARSGRRLPASGVTALTAAAMAVVLVLPLAVSTRVVAGGQQDSGRPGALPVRAVESLSSFLRAHRHGARYDVATLPAAQAGPLIARDGRPVLVLTSLGSTSLLSTDGLADAVHAGRVRYALVARVRCWRTPATRRRCTPMARWILAHGTDVGAQAGIGRGRLLRLRA